MRGRGIVVAWLLTSGCGSGGSDTNTGDAGATISDAGTTPDRDEPAGIVPRCPGASWTTAPSGAACVATRIEHAKGLEGTCYGPAVGATCDRLEVTVTSSEQAAVPSGFVCGAVEGGVVTCRWAFTGDASFGTLDDAALEAACAATAGAPSARVRCVKFGS